MESSKVKPLEDGETREGIIHSASKKSILFIFDTGSKMSSFDACLAYDAGYDAVMLYENVTPKDAERLVQDALFSRGPKRSRFTSFFIVGKDLGKAEAVLEAIKNIKNPRLVSSIIIDPRGAYTTAAAMIAKTEQALLTTKMGKLENKRCIIFGTGPIGKIATVLLGKLGCEVTIASTNPNRLNGEKYIKKVVKLLLKRYDVDIRGVYAPGQKERIHLLREADVVFCAAAPGIQVIDRSILEEIGSEKIMVDVNVVPPLGIEGIKPEDDMREIHPGIFGIGPVTIGKLKCKLEMKILREAREAGEKIYDYKLCLKKARSLFKGAH